MIITAINLQAQNVTTPRTVSYGAELSQTIGLTKITVNYSRPRVTLNGNDRTGQIWGQQVPYELTKINFASNGEIPWRAGANENTTISFSHDVKIEGQDLASGVYGLHMIIHESDEATVIFSNNSSSWGSFWYNQSEDALRVKVKTEKIAHTEVLTYDFIAMDQDNGVLALSWESKRIPFKIDVDLHEQVLANMRNELRSIAGFGWQGYATAANYCMNNNVNLEEGLQWAELSINNQKQFGNLFAKAGILKLMGKPNAEVFPIADEAAQLANIGQLNFMGYQMLGQQEVDKAIEYFQLNVKKNPTDANVYDSLGEAYKTKGENKLAIKSFKKSLSLNPPANVKANSIKLLKELGVDVEEGI